MDKITYCADINLLKQELVDKGFYDEESQSYTHGMTLTPIVYNGNATLALVRGDVEAFDNLEVLGTYEEIFADPVLDAKYKSVYPYDVPIEYVDEEGNPQQYLRPEKIGEFA